MTDIQAITLNVLFRKNLTFFAKSLILDVLYTSLFSQQKQPFADVLQNNVHKKFAKFTEKHLRLSNLSNKVADLRDSGTGVFM